ncbi:MAG: amidohydrolase family protein [Candidatus Aminicenantes bacterium]|nr:MAG: amidohydrolase family protein [Candidatus Aminicenantes bacterium]
MNKLKFFRVLAGCLLLTLTFASLAISGEKLTIRVDRMLDVVSGRIIKNAYVTVEGRKIVGVGGSELAEGTKVIDLGDMTLLPGLIDMHVHLAYDIEMGFVYRSVHDGPADDALRAARNSRQTLMAGFTTVREAGSRNFVDVALMKAVERGFVEGPWIFPCGHGISITGGHGDEIGFQPGILEMTPEFGIADGPEEVLRAVRYQIKHGAKQIKMIATAGVLSFEESGIAQQYSDEEMRVIVEEAARHGLKVFAHAHGTEGIIAAVKAGVASIEHGSLVDDEAIKLMKEKGAYLVPTTYLAESIDLERLPPLLRSKAEYILPLARKNLRRAIQSGVKIAFGTDAAVFPHGDNAKEFAVYVKLGMSPIDAIRTATINAIDLLGVDDRGIIEEGKLADLIAVQGNPLENIAVLEDVKFVMHGGKIVKR